MSISALAKTIEAGIKAHKPEIMVGIGLTAGVGAVIFAAKETPACLDAFSAAEEKSPTTTIKNEEGEEIEVHVGLTLKEKLVILGRHQWKAALLEVAAIFFIIYGTKIRIDGYAALAAMYGVTKAELDDLKQVIAEQPENWKKKFREKVAESHVEHSDPNSIPDARMSNAEVPMPLPLFWDDQAKVYFRMSEEDLRGAVAEFTNQITTDPFQATSMNDWMRTIDHEEVAYGDHYLMTMNDPDWDGALKYYQIGVKEAPNGEPARTMTFSKDYYLDTRGIYSNV